MGTLPRHATCRMTRHVSARRSSGKCHDTKRLFLNFCYLKYSICSMIFRVCASSVCGDSLPFSVDGAVFCSAPVLNDAAVRSSSFGMVLFPPFLCNGNVSFSLWVMLPSPSFQRVAYFSLPTPFGWCLLLLFFGVVQYESLI